MSIPTLITHNEPACRSCSFVMPSRTASSTLRCGINYFNSSALFRKVGLMQSYPQVAPHHVCESWKASKLERLENW